MTDDKLLLRPESVARVLDIDARTLRKWISVGQFPAAELVLSGKLKFWRRSTVDRWIEQHCQGGVHSAQQGR